MTWSIIVIGILIVCIGLMTWLILKTNNNVTLVKRDKDAGKAARDSVKKL